VWTPANHQVNALGLTGVVVVKENLRLFGQERSAVFVVSVLCSAGSPDHLFRRDAIDSFGIETHEVLSAASYNVGLVTAATHVLQNFKHRLRDQVGVRSFPARMLGGFDPFL